MAGVEILKREMYTEAEAARLLAIPKSTLHYWLDGRDPAHPPVIRVEPDPGAPVTWAEFIEAGLLAVYRRRHRVRMAELRAFIDRLRSEYQVPYPLAHERPFVGAGRRLLRQVQDDSGLRVELRLVAETGGQYILTPSADQFYERVTWQGDIAAGWCPHEQAGSPVRMTPGVRFGLPHIRGIRTEILWEHVTGGEDIKEVAEAFDVTSRDVHWALAFENALRAA